MSGLCHEKAVEVLLTVKEPIIVEVERRITESTNQLFLLNESISKSIGIQTDEYVYDESPISVHPDDLNGFEECLASDIDIEVGFFFSLLLFDQKIISSKFCFADASTSCMYIKYIKHKSIKHQEFSKKHF